MGTNVSSTRAFLKEKVITRKNEPCYSNFCDFSVNGLSYKETPPGPKEYAILIEKEKIFYPIEEIFRYFELLKETGLEIGKYYIENDEILVFVDEMSKRKRLMCATFIRYLWENKYGRGQDKYYLIYEHFMKLVKFFPKKEKFQLLMFATNLFQEGSERMYIDKIHCIIGNVQTKIMSFKDIKFESNKDNRYSFFNNIFNIKYEKDSFEERKKILEYNTKEDYQFAINLLVSKNKKIKFPEDFAINEITEPEMAVAS